VETVQPKRGELIRTFAGTATLAAERAASLVSENGGEGHEDLRRGKAIAFAAGQVLARIDGERARLALAQTASVAQRLDHEADRANQLLDKHMIAADAVERAPLRTRRPACGRRPSRR
jgi:membrane fusion protein (multidrug efflux system)